MRILVVSEGRHELGGVGEESPLAILVERIISRPAEFTREKVSSPKVRIHRKPGEPGGFWKRALVWIRYAKIQEFDALVLVIDQDGSRQGEQEIANAQADDQVALPRALGVAIRTFDAWMLADERSLTAVLGSEIPRQKDPESIRDPKAVSRELLSNSITDCSLTEMYAAVARGLDVATLESRCPQGFALFAERLRQI